LERRRFAAAAKIYKSPQGERGVEEGRTTYGGDQLL